jgi:Skp family chaperone for outer membrane proteins
MPEESEDLESKIMQEELVDALETSIDNYLNARLKVVKITFRRVILAKWVGCYPYDITREVLEMLKDRYNDSGWKVEITPEDNISFTWI